MSGGLEKTTLQLQDGELGEASNEKTVFLCFPFPNRDKTDEFSEKFQTAFAPPPPFSENYIAIFSGKNR